jgi:phage gpG-like protein
MTARVTIRDTDKGFKRIRAMMRGKTVVEIGIRGDSAPRDSGEIDNVGLGTIHEFGATIRRSKADGSTYLIAIPARSFLRDTLDTNKDAYIQVIARLKKRLVPITINPPQALNLLGLRVQGDIKRRIGRGIDPPNTEETIARKGSTTPLIDTGNLRQSITYQVV